MKRLFDVAGVDYLQWRALFRAYTMIDFSAVLGGYGDTNALRAIGDLLLFALAFTFMGILPAVAIWSARDTFFAATVMTSATAWMAGMAVLASRTSSILTPDDYQVIGFRPIDSRTYFAVRLTAMLSQAFEAAALSGVLPVLAFAARPAGSWPVAAAAAVAILGTALATTFAVVVFHGWLLGAIRPARLARAVVYAQALSILVFMAVYVAGLMRFVDMAPSGVSLAVTTVLARSAWTLWYPGTWFASYVEIASGHAGRFELTAAALSVVLLAGLAAALRGRLSTQYALRVAEMTAEPDTTAGRAGRAWAFLQPETRAMLILILGHLRSDVTVQMGAVTGLLMGGVLIGMNLFIEPGGDPFVRTDLNIGSFALFLLPLTFRQTLVTSQAFEASWPFVVAPSERARLVRASRDIVAVLVLAPALIVVAGISAFSIRDAGHALVDAAVLGATAYAALQAYVLMDPALPLSLPLAGRRAGFPATLGTLPATFAGSALLALFRLVLYPSPARIAIGMAGLAGLICGLEWLTGRRLARRPRAK